MTDDLTLLLEAAREAGQIARDRRAAGLDVQTKVGGSPVTDGDLAANAFLSGRLRAARPDYGWLSEESQDDPDRLDRQRIFVVDPIDGTVAFIKDRPWWTVALAVVENGQPIAAVVHAPMLDETFTAVRGAGAWLNGHAIRASDADRLEDASMLADAALLERPIWEEPWPAMRLHRRNSIAYRMALVGAGGFDAAIGGARRDEERSRAKERFFSHRNAKHGWDPRNQRPELWRVFNTCLKLDESMRVFPLSNWTELDVWNYIRAESIPIVPLYFAKERPVLRRHGAWIVRDDERLPLEPDEKVEMRRVRFRTLGCYPLTGAIDSDATTLDGIIEEMRASRFSERQGRLIDNDESSSMEKKKREGYF